MTSGFGGFSLSPVLSLSSSDSLASRSVVTSARRDESGDHSYDEMWHLTSVSWNASPPRRSSAQTCFPLAGPGRDDRNVRYRPSGLQRGAVADASPPLYVSRTLLLPSQPTIQISVICLSAAESTRPTVYAIHFPSGETRGSSTS